MCGDSPLAHPIGIREGFARMNTSELLQKAIGIAVEAHRGQKDKYGAPYILHPLRVMSRLDDAPGRIAAILHDVVEDSEWTFEDLKREGFPKNILDALDCLTRRERESYEQFVNRSARNPLGRRVKLADLEDNMDLRRIPALKAKDLERLQRYHKAWRKLSGNKGSSDPSLRLRLT